MKKTFLLWVYLFISAPGQAQSINGVDSLNNINAIKRDTSFIYAEATMKDAIARMTARQKSPVKDFFNFILIINVLLQISTGRPQG